MQEWTPSPETAKVIASSGLGALMLAYLRHPGSIVRAGALVFLGIGMALVFTDLVAAWTGLQPVPVAAGIGLVGKALAESALRAAERFDLTALVKRKD